MNLLRTTVSTLVIALAGPAIAQDAIVIGTGSTGGAYYPIGVGMARFVSDADPEWRVDGVSSGGSTENVQLIARGEIEIGITNGVVATFAADLAAVVEDIRAVGHISLRGIAAELTARGIRTRKGGQWQVLNVSTLLLRLHGLSTATPKA